MIKLTQDLRPDVVKPLEKPEQLGELKAWSYSALKVFEECPYRSYIQKVKKIPEPSNPAADRGTEIHQQAEDYVKGELGEFPSTLTKFKNEFCMQITDICSPCNRQMFPLSYDYTHIFAY